MDATQQNQEAPKSTNNNRPHLTTPELIHSLVGRMREFSRLMSKTNHEIISHLEKISPKKTEQ